jgi:hypothetical protein
MATGRRLTRARARLLTYAAIAGMLITLLLASASTASAGEYRASDYPAASGWGYSLSRDGRGSTPKWAHTSAGWQFGWRVDRHQVYITPYGVPGWSWTWCHCNGGTWSAAYTADLVFVT